MFEVHAGTIKDYEAFPSKNDTILWCIMGFFPYKLSAKYIIHDYRSLSVGKFSVIKDRIKRQLNHKPNLRIFQNEQLSQAMDFKDKIPWLTIPMGVPDWIYKLQPDPSLPQGDYCYIGEISKERGLHLVIDSFLATKTKDRKLVLVGLPQKSILDEYQQEKNIIFTGPLPQELALKVVLNCRYAICSIPSRYPYDLQAPTKYLEYAALGKTILCNDCPSNRYAYSIAPANVLFLKQEIFSSDIEEKLKNSQNVTSNPTDSKHLRWSDVILQSGILSHLSNLTHHKPLNDH